MPIKFHCASCGKRLGVADNLAGRRGKCPQCGAVFAVPISTSPPPPRVMHQDPTDYNVSLDDLPVTPPARSVPVAQVACPSCGSGVPVGAAFCPVCGVPTRRSDPAPVTNGVSRLPPAAPAADTLIPALAIISLVMLIVGVCLVTGGSSTGGGSVLIYFAATGMLAAWIVHEGSARTFLWPIQRLADKALSAIRDARTRLCTTAAALLLLGAGIVYVVTASSTPEQRETRMKEDRETEKQVLLTEKPTRIADAKAALDRGDQKKAREILMPLLSYDDLRAEIEPLLARLREMARQYARRRMEEARVAIGAGNCDAAIKCLDDAEDEAPSLKADIASLRQALQGVAHAQKWDAAQDAGELVQGFGKMTSIQKDELNRQWTGRTVRGSGTLEEAREDAAFASIEHKLEVKIDLGSGRGYACVYVGYEEREKWLGVKRGETVWFLGTVHSIEVALFGDEIAVEPECCDTGHGPPK